MRRSEKISLLVGIIVVGFTFAVIYHYLQTQAYPYNTFLFRADDRFNDFYNPLRGSFDLDPYNPARITYIGGYFPFGYLVAFLFSLIQPPMLALTLFLGGFLAYLGAYLIHTMYGRFRLAPAEWTNVFVLAVMTYPVLFVLDRANFDIVEFVLISLFVLTFQKRQFVLGAFLLACASAMKGYPAVLFTLFLFDRRYREFLLGGLFTLVLTFASLALFKDGAVLEFQKMLISFQRASRIAFEAGALMRFNSSLYTALLYALEGIKPHIAQSIKFNLAYLAVAAATYLGICVLVWKREYPFWAKLLALTAMMILFPYSSGDYRLIMLYPPLVLYLDRDTASRADWIIVALFGLLFIPKAYYVLTSDANIGLLLNPLLLIGLLVVSMISATRPRPSEATVLGTPIGEREPKPS